MIRVPIIVGEAGAGRVLGFMQIDDSQLPDSADFVFCCSARPLRAQGPGLPPYVLTECHLVNDSEYTTWLREEEKRRAIA